MSNKSLTKFALKSENFAMFYYSGSTKKVQKSTTTYRLIVNLFQLNSMGKTIELVYECGRWQNLEKNAADSNIFLSHMKYERRLIINFWNIS